MQRYVSEIDIVYCGISKLKLLLGNSLEGGVYELLTGIVSFYRSEFGAHYLIALTGGAQLAVFAGGLDVVAEKLFLCHINTSVS